MQTQPTGAALCMWRFQMSTHTHTHAHTHTHTRTHTHTEGPHFMVSHKYHTSWYFTLHYALIHYSHQAHIG